MSLSGLIARGGIKVFTVGRVFTCGIKVSNTCNSPCDVAGLYRDKNGVELVEGALSGRIARIDINGFTVGRVLPCGIKVMNTCSRTCDGVGCERVYYTDCAADRACLGWRPSV